MFTLLLGSYQVGVCKFIEKNIIGFEALEQDTIKILYNNYIVNPEFQAKLIPVTLANEETKDYIKEIGIPALNQDESSKFHTCFQSVKAQTYHLAKQY